MTRKERAEQLFDFLDPLITRQGGWYSKTQAIKNIETALCEERPVVWEDVQAFVARHCADSYLVMDGQYVKLGDALAAKAREVEG